MEIYCHFDGYPENMMPALAAHDPEAILKARELRQITPTLIELFCKAPAPRWCAAPEFQSWAAHAYS